MNEVMERLTPTEKKLFKILLDGERHAKDELRIAIDPLASFESMRNCILTLRGKLPNGVEIVCEIRNRAQIFYRLVYKFVPSISFEMLEAMKAKPVSAR